MLQSNLRNHGGPYHKTKQTFPQGLYIGNKIFSSFYGLLPLELLCTLPVNWMIIDQMLKILDMQVSGHKIYQNSILVVIPLVLAVYSSCLLPTIVTVYNQ